MPRRVRLVIVSEDRQQEMFLRQLFKARGLNVHDMRFETCPRGSGAGDAWVIAQHAKEAARHRSRSHAQPDIGLVSAIDADERQVLDRHRQLDEASSAVRGAKERIAYVVPRRNIETWIRVSSGEAADEISDYKVRSQEPVDCQKLVDVFQSDAGEGVLPSIRTAGSELQRVR